MLALLLLPLAVLTSVAAPMTKTERDRLVSHLKMTTSWVRDEVAGLSEAQLQFKPKPDAWSVLMVLEHLTIAEPQYWQWLQEALQLPATDKTAETKDSEILWYGIDRTQRTRTAEAREATGAVTDVKSALAAFGKLRTECSNSPGRPTRTCAGAASKAETWTYTSGS